MSHQCIIILLISLYIPGITQKFEIGSFFVPPPWMSTFCNWGGLILEMEFEFHIKYTSNWVPPLDFPQFICKSEQILIKNAHSSYCNLYGVRVPNVTKLGVRTILVLCPGYLQYFINIYNILLIFAIFWCYAWDICNISLIFAIFHQYL